MRRKLDPYRIAICYLIASSSSSSPGEQADVHHYFQLQVTKQNKSRLQRIGLHSTVTIGNIPQMSRTRSRAARQSLFDVTIASTTADGGWKW